MTGYTGGATLTVTATTSARRRSDHHGTANLSVTAVGHAGPVAFAAALAQKCSLIHAATRRHRRDEQLLRRQPPLIRIWDAEWALHFIGGNERRANFSFISNDTGPGELELPADCPAAQWIHDHQGRIARGEGRNVFITVDHCGARWSGIMDNYRLEQRGDGDQVLVATWLHDYEHLKWRTVWSNPFLPAWFQFPRAFILAGPVPWVLKVTLFLQIFREHNPLISIPDDPLNLASWFTSLDQSTWNMVVKPTGFIEAMASGAVWGIAIARWANWHDMAHQMLEDSELSVRCDRYLDGDPPPWPGANLRHGTLVIDIVDKSGVYIGTANGGTVFDGLVRTVAEFTDDFLDSTLDVALDTSTPADYWRVGYRFTHPQDPYVIYLEDDSSPIQTSQWANSPAKGVEVACGGHSMPGINETISATVQVIFDLLGNLILLGSLGASIDALIKPLYEDTVLAWWSVKSIPRAQNSGWSRLYEYFQPGANKAYTITSLLVLRAALWATRTVISWQISVWDGVPFVVGDRGLGHFFLDDRIGLALKGDSTIHMDRVRKLDLAWDDESFPEWHLTVGDDRIWQDPAQVALGKIENVMAGLRDLGVW
ncbi:Gp37-like protein [Mycobacterium kansasii]